MVPVNVYTSILYHKGKKLLFYYNAMIPQTAEFVTNKATGGQRDASYGYERGKKESQKDLWNLGANSIVVFCRFCLSKLHNWIYPLCVRKKL
jgi:hypothetical protein